MPWPTLPNLKKSIMDFKNITKSLLDFSGPKLLKAWVEQLLDKVENLSADNIKKDSRIDRLEAEIRKLKKLPAKPKFDSSDKTSELDKDKDEEDDDESYTGSTKTKKDETPDEKMRRLRKAAARRKRRKKKDLKIDLTKKLEVKSEDIDGTFEYKGTRKVIVQNILFQRNNIEFELEKYYSKEYRKTVEADLPPGYGGGYFGPDLIAFIKCSYYEGDVTIKKIFKLLDSIGIMISIKQINRIINDRPDELLKELEDARVAGIKKADFQQVDDTTTVIIEAKKTHKHQSVFTTVTCNPYFTFLYTSPSKNRYNAVIALCGGIKKPLFKMNMQALLVMFGTWKSFKIQKIMESSLGDKIYSEKEVDEHLKSDTFSSLKPKVIKELKTAMLVGAFYDGHLGVTGAALVSDDAPQFNNLYDSHILCWYHEMRHYKELSPIIKEHEDQLKAFFTEVKSIYKVFKKWILTREEDIREHIFKWFNEFFQKKSGYKLLDDRKNLTFKKMEKMLAALWTEVKVPLQNNESERDIRGRKLKLKISLFDKTWAGADARDLYISLKQTCRKNGVSFYQFLLDRTKKTGEIPTLAQIIQDI